MKFDHGKGNLVCVSGEFELSEFVLSRFYGICLLLLLKFFIVRLPSAREVSRFLFKSFYVRRLQKQMFFFSPIQILIIRTIRNSADGHISSLGDLCSIKANQANWRAGHCKFVNFCLVLFQPLRLFIQLCKDSFHFHFFISSSKY